MIERLLLTVLLLTVLAAGCDRSGASPTTTATKPAATTRPTAATEELAATVTATATAAALALAPFSHDELGLRGVAPREWAEVEPGHFSRGVWPTDLARLTSEFYPGMTLDWAVEAVVLPALHWDELPPRVGRHESAALSWDLHKVDTVVPGVDRVVVDLALAESEAGIYMVALMSSRDEHEALRQAVFVPAVQGLEPLPVTTSDVHYRKSLALFDYDRQAPLDIEEVRTTTSDGVTMTDFTYASPKGGRVPATLIVPDGAGPFAGLVVMHGMPGKRQHLFSLARECAKIGAVVILIDAPHARPGNVDRPEGPILLNEQDREEQIQLIVDLQRAVDLLVARPDVDAGRLAYSGVSYGGAMGGLLAGVEDRLQAYALVVGDGGLVTHVTGFDDFLSSDFYELSWEDQARWLAAMWPIEPLHFVGHAAPAALLFQNGRQDRLVPPSDALWYQQAGSEPKQVMWYDAGHGLSVQILREQLEWLERYIGIDAEAFCYDCL
jgi:dienelactone hydrolase